MRYRPKNLRDENPEVLNQLAKYNPYIARVYDFPDLLLPHPTPDNFKELWARKNKDYLGNHLTSKVHIEIGCGSSRYLINWAFENVPSSGLDDITDATALGIPEFSTIMMPVASVLLIVGNRIRSKKNNEQ